MTDPRTLPDDRPNIGTDPLETDIVELQGDRLPIDQDAFVDPDEIEEVREQTLSEQEWGVVEAPDMRPGETSDPLVAIEEGQVWVPPSDPPFVTSDDPEGIESPGGDVSEAEGDLNGAIRAELIGDAATTGLADRIEIAVVGSTAILRGQVDGIEDSDALLEVASRVDGIDDVIDETEIAGLG